METRWVVNGQMSIEICRAIASGKKDLHKHSALKWRVAPILLHIRIRYLAISFGVFFLVSNHLLSKMDGNF